MKIKHFTLLIILSITLCSSSLISDPVTTLRDFIHLISEGNFSKAKNYLENPESKEILDELENLWKVNSKSFNKNTNYYISLIKSTNTDALLNVKDENNSINITLKKKNEEWKVVLKTAAIIDLVRGNTRDEDAYAEDYAIEIGDLGEEEPSKGENNPVVTQNKIIRDYSVQKDVANVFYKSKFTLFDFYTDEPIFPDGKGLYHIYYASNEDKTPRSKSISGKDLENLYFYKFKNYQNCINWAAKSKVSFNNNVQSNKPETVRINNTESKQKCSQCKGLGRTIGCSSLFCKQGKVHCSYCQGKGRDAYSGKICLHCNGTGIAICPRCNGKYSTIQNTCDFCNGKGVTKLVVEVCWSCDGNGKSSCSYSRCKKGFLTCTNPASHSDKHCSYCNQDAGQPHGSLCDYAKSACRQCKGSGQIKVENRL
jgi:hypothetical protein